VPTEKCSLDQQPLDLQVGQRFLAAVLARKSPSSPRITTPDPFQEITMRSVDKPFSGVC
jgi:hypothetical protein